MEKNNKKLIEDTVTWGDLNHRGDLHHLIKM